MLVSGHICLQGIQDRSSIVTTVIIHNDDLMLDGFTKQRSTDTPDCFCQATLFIVGGCENAKPHLRPITMN